MALFGGTSQSRNQQKNLVEFRAGKMTLKGNTVTPDKRKGLVYIFQSDDGLTHFCWKDRKTGTVEDDLIVFPDDCEYKKVTQCKEGSRVYLLKFKTSARKLFFWMQEPKADGDDALEQLVNESLNNPGASAGGRAGGQSGNVTPTPSESEMQALISNMSQSQLMQLIGGDLGSASGLLSHLTQQIGGLGGSENNSSSTNSSSRPPTATTTSSSSSAPTAPSNASTTTAPTSTVPKTENQSGKSGSSKIPASQAAIQLQDLQKILSNITPPSASAVDLSSGVNGELIRRITTNPETCRKLAPLLPQFGGPEVVDLPKGTDETTCKREVEETLLSPQFQNALSAFCAAFPTGQLAPLVSQFGMGQDAVNAAQSGNLDAFLDAIQKEAANTAIPEGNAETEDMNVD